MVFGVVLLTAVLLLLPTAEVFVPPPSLCRRRSHALPHSPQPHYVTSILVDGGTDSEDGTDSDTEQVCFAADIVDDIGSLLDRGALLRLHPFFDIHDSTDASGDASLGVLSHGTDASTDASTDSDSDNNSDNSDSDSDSDSDAATTLAGDLSAALTALAAHPVHAVSTPCRHAPRTRAGGAARGAEEGRASRTPATGRGEEGAQAPRARKRRLSESFLVTPHKHTAKKPRRTAVGCPRKVLFIAELGSSDDSGADTSGGTDGGHAERRQHPRHMSRESKERPRHTRREHKECSKHTRGEHRESSKHTREEHKENTGHTHGEHSRAQEARRTGRRAARILSRIRGSGAAPRW